MNKEIFSTQDYTQEEIYRMSHYADENGMSLFYQGDPEDAPVSAIYVYKPVKSVYKVHTEDRVTIKDGLSMPLDGFTLLGKSYLSEDNPTPSNPSIMHVVAPYNGFTVTDGTNTLIVNTLQPLCSLSDTLRDYYQDGYMFYNTACHQLDADWAWMLDYTHTTDTIFAVKVYLLDGGAEQYDMISTHFTAADNLNQVGNMMIKDHHLFLALDKTLISSLSGFKIWLLMNEVYIIYEREAVLKISAPACNLATHDGDTVISNNTKAEMLIAYRTAPNARIWEKQEDGSFLELQNYFISFDTAGKTYNCPDVVWVESGMSTILPTISAPGWIFLGWYVPSLGETINGEFTPTKTETLIAQ